MSDTRRLEECLRDLVGLLALPSLGYGRTPEEILPLVVDSVGTTVRANWVYGVLSPSFGTVSVTEHSRATEFTPRDREVLLGACRRMSAEKAAGIVSVEKLGDAPEIRLIALPLGFYGESGTLVFGSFRAEFPDVLENVRLRAAASLATSTLQQAKLLMAAQEADRRKDEFLALLGHELRNPLAPILSGLQLMKLRSPERSMEREIIERQVHHLMKLVDDLLDVSRITRGSLELRVETVDLAHVLSRAIEIAEPLFEKHRHVLAYQAPSEIRINGDPVRLAQVFSNLLTNAARYTPPQGRIEIRTAVQQNRDEVEVSVKDNGRGIDETSIHQIFQPFFQAQRDRDRLQGGLGLGLALVRSLVAMHGGSVTAASDGVGNGSLFTVRLPLAQSAVLTPSTACFPSPGIRAPRRVLVVDDNREAADLVGAGLASSGHQVEVCYDGAQALRVASAFQPEIAILDLGMPGMDGTTLARHLTHEHPDSPPACVALTGYADAQSVLRAREAGFVQHLVKPVDLSTLLDVIEDLSAERARAAARGRS